MVSERIPQCVVGSLNVSKKCCCWYFKGFQALFKVLCIVLSGRNVAVFCLMTGSVGSILNGSKECFGILNDSKIFSSVLLGSKKGWHNFG